MLHLINFTKNNYFIYSYKNESIYLFSLENSQYYPETSNLVFLQ